MNEKFFSKNISPKISCIVPVYNVEKYLHRCVDSILAQTFADFELILVDDGSPDNCGNICDEYSKKDDRVRVIHQENRGVSAARNAGLDAACGEYVCFVDSDDWVEADYMKAMYDVAEKTDADFVLSNHIEHFKNSEERRVYSHGKNCIENINKVLLDDLPGMMFCKLVRLSLINKNQLRFNENIKLAEDTVFSVQIYVTNPKIFQIDSLNYHYDRSRENSVTYKLDYRKEMEFAKSNHFLDDYFMEKNLSEEIFYAMNDRKCVRLCKFFSNSSFSELNKIFLLYPEVHKFYGVARKSDRIKVFFISHKLLLCLYFIKFIQVLKRRITK